MKKLTYEQKEKRAGYCFTLPALIFLLGFILFPILYNVLMSFREVNLMTLNRVQPFAGLENYRAILRMPVFGKAFANTLLFTFVSLFFQFIIGFALALLFSRKFRLNNMSRGLMLVCWLIPLMAVASVWKWLFASDSTGIINFLLMKLRLIQEPVKWLLSPGKAMLALIIVNIWRGVPFNMLLLATGLTTLPRDVFEAASIDGATKWQSFVYMTIPLLRPTIISVVTLGFIYTFKTFDLVFIMTGGGPLYSTEILATISYRLTFNDFEFGMGSAVANVMLVVLVIVGLVNLKFTGKDEVMS
ncbi:carbohydrate ABC transporter permease [Breznakiella homolactica]|uniref:Sugar ABC transporter permease n=1 Tax=Breznakiella homolactica TaxID=2798577 RepID=A0A7T7XMP8_9SPIR|nr:sugar ABC transporter permease [Breznakiella homolactica]QQO09175.1 sugar ABC transporter permease [Breznakiella homolactica]